jgi:hypothetical protein
MVNMQTLCVAAKPTALESAFRESGNGRAHPSAQPRVRQRRVEDIIRSQRYPLTT